MSEISTSLKNLNEFKCGLLKVAIDFKILRWKYGFQKCAFEIRSKNSDFGTRILKSEFFDDFRKHTFENDIFKNFGFFNFE